MAFLTFYIHSDAPGDSLLRGVSLKLQEVTMQLLGGASFLPTTASLLPEQTLCWGADLSTDLEGERTEKKTLRMFCLLLRGAEGEKMNLWLNLLAINRWTPRVGNCVSVWSTACMKAGRIHLWDYFTWRRRRSALFLFHGCLPPLFIEQDFSPFLFRFFLLFLSDRWRSPEDGDDCDFFDLSPLGTMKPTFLFFVWNVSMTSWMDYQS